VRVGGTATRISPTLAKRYPCASGTRQGEELSESSEGRARRFVTCVSPVGIPVCPGPGGSRWRMQQVMQRSSLGGATCGAHKKGQYLGMAQEG